MADLMNFTDSALGDDNLLYNNDPFIGGSTYPHDNESVLGFYHDYDEPRVARKQTNSDNSSDFNVDDIIWNDMNIDEAIGKAGFDIIDEFDFDLSYSESTSQIQGKLKTNGATDPGSIADRDFLTVQALNQHPQPLPSAEVSDTGSRLDSPLPVTFITKKPTLNYEEGNQIKEYRADETNGTLQPGREIAVRPAYTAAHVSNAKPSSQLAKSRQNFHLFPVKVQQSISAPRHVPYPSRVSLYPPKLKKQVTNQPGKGPVDPENFPQYTSLQTTNQVYEAPKAATCDTVLKQANKIPKARLMKIERDRQSNHVGCIYCHHNCINDLAMEFHEVEKHADLFCYQCIICNRFFENVHIVNRHLQLEHRVGKVPLLNHSVFVHGEAYDQKRAVNARRVSGMIWRFIKDHLHDTGQLLGTAADVGIIKKYAHELFHPAFTNTRFDTDNMPGIPYSFKNDPQELLKAIKKQYIYGDNIRRHKLRNVPEEVHIDHGAEPNPEKWFPKFEKVTRPTNKDSPNSDSSTVYVIAKPKLDMSLYNKRPDFTHNFANGKNPQPLALPATKRSADVSSSLMARGPVTKTRGLVVTRYPAGPKQPRPGQKMPPKFPGGAHRPTEPVVTVSPKTGEASTGGQTVVVDLKQLPGKGPVWVDPMIRGDHRLSHPSYLTSILRKPNTSQNTDPVPAKQASNNPYQ